mmetsp:Transcript_27246/g.45577  ORF Transcript_27246/g.45577 Transcript_27246/m.45577 type:complete len:307 (-) Transcript_27246:118-1038(-)
MSGLESSRRQMATRRRSPPLSVATRASGGGQRRASMARSLMRSISHPFLESISVCRRSIFFISASTSAVGSPIAALTSSKSLKRPRRSASAGSMLLSTVSPSSRGGSCCRYPILMPSTSSQSPWNSLSVWARIFSRVLLPDPLAPRIPILAPRYIPRLTFFRICLPLGTTLDTLCMVKIVLRVSVWYADPSFTCPGDLKLLPPEDFKSPLGPPLAPPPALAFFMSFLPAVMTSLLRERPCFAFDLSCERLAVSSQAPFLKRDKPLPHKLLHGRELGTRRHAVRAGTPLKAAGHGSTQPVVYMLLAR